MRQVSGRLRRGEGGRGRDAHDHTLSWGSDENVLEFAAMVAKSYKDNLKKKKPPMNCTMGSTSTYLTAEVFADELVDRHERLRPVLVRVPGTDFHWDSSTAGNLLKILQTRRQIRVALPKTCWALGHAGRLWGPPYRETLR